MKCNNKIYNSPWRFKIVSMQALIIYPKIYKVEINRTNGILNSFLGNW